MYSFYLRKSLRLLAPLVVLGVASSTRAAAIIIGDGDDLVAAVAAAADNDVIEIQSNDTFVGTLAWSNKFLTIQAGYGYQPTVKGSPFVATIDPFPFPEIGRPAMGPIDGDEGTGGLFRGLRFEHGEDGDLEPPYDTRPAEHFIAIDLSATGDNRTDVTFEQCEFFGETYLGGTSDYQIDAWFENNVFDGPLRLSGTGSRVVNVEAHRNYFRDGMSASGISAAMNHVNATGNVFAAGPNTAYAYGIRVGGTSLTTTTGRFVNNTVVGYDTGLLLNADGSVSVSFENMLLANDDDIVGDLDSNITNSLISDGTSDGLNGNFAATPLLGPEHQLLAGSPGIDAGNNNALNLPDTDFLGNPRIVDGDGDSLARVDVGAYELQYVPEPCSLALGALAVLACTAVRRRVTMLA